MVLDLPTVLIGTTLPYPLSASASRASWHRGITVKKLSTKRKRDTFTHDAKLDGSDDVRGVTLSAAIHAEGCWVCLEKSNPVEVD